MKFSDIIIENKKQELTEKPMGVLKTMGNKVASAFGSGQAQGRLDTGKEANALRKEFDIFLGKTGQNPTGDLVLQFLKQKGYPTKSAQNFIAAGKPQAAQPKAQDPTAAPAQQPAAPQAEPGKRIEPTLDEPAQQPSKDDIAKRVKANVGKSQAATKASGFGQKPEPAKPDAGAGAMAQFVKQQTGDNPITMKPAPQKAPAPNQQTADPQPAVNKTSNYDPNTGKPISDKAKADADLDNDPKFRQDQLDLDQYMNWADKEKAAGRDPVSLAYWKANVKGKKSVAQQPAPAPVPTAQQPQGEKPGFLKTATDKIQDRAKNQEIDAIKAKPGFQRTASDKLKLKAAGVKESFEQRLAFYLLLEEVLSGKQLDQIFLAAAQEKAKGGVAGASSAASQPASAGGGAGAPQDNQPDAAMNQPAGAEKGKGGSFALKAAAAAYDGLRGAALGSTKLGQEEPGKELKDTSGRVPPEIMGQLNKLTNKQRAELRKELDKA